MVQAEAMRVKADRRLLSVRNGSNALAAGLGGKRTFLRRNAAPSIEA